MARSDDQGEVALTFFLPPPELKPFITAVYHMNVGGSGRGQNSAVRDWLHPEWANLRVSTSGQLMAGIGTEDPQPMPRMGMTGPTSRTINFVAPPGRTWGIGILPLGWARLVDAAANLYADRSVDVERDPALAHLKALGRLEDKAPLEEERDHIFAMLKPLLATAHRREDDLVRAQQARLDPACATVAQLAQSLSMTTRTLERFSCEAFGFSPQLLLRRQRFLRSLAQFMLDPSMHWIDTLDPQYYDQSQFTRDFKRFMGMAPREYARLPHPVLGAAAHARKEVVGEAVQVLHKPEGAPGAD